MHSILPVQVMCIPLNIFVLNDLAIDPWHVQFHGMFNDFLDFSTLALEIAPLYAALGRMSDQMIHVSGNSLE